MATNENKHKKKPRRAHKIGRNKAKCERYRRDDRREINKERRAAKAVKRRSSTE